MTNQKSTKRALLLSALALLMCVSMLIGSTFAWFTDSVTSGSNVITAGNLDIVVEYTLDGETWKDLDGAKDLFQKGLWEPGHTEVVALKITNNGSLALKYAASMNIFSETVGKTKDGQDIVLSDILTVSTLTQQANDAFGVGDIALDLAFNGENSVDYENPTSFNAGNVLGNDVELLPGAAHYVIIKVDMAETVGNEANHDGEHVPSIEFGINVLATQYTHEYDSFDNQYDDIALVSNADELKAAIAEGKNVMLTADVAVDANNTITVADDADIILDLNGHKINGTSSASGNNRAIFIVRGEMSVIGNGTVSFVHTGTNMGWGNLSAPFSVEGGELTLGEGVTVVNLGGTDMAFAVDVNTTSGETTLNVDGAVLYSTYTGVRIFNNHNTAKGIVNFNDGVIEGPRRDIWAQAPNGAATVGENAVVNIADGFTYNVEVESDGIGRNYFFEYDAAYVGTAAALREISGENVVVVLCADITLGDDTTQKSMGAYYPDAKNVTIDGNGHTLTLKGQMPGSDWQAQYYAGIIAPNATVTVKDLTIVNEKLGNNGTNISADREAVYTMVRGTSVLFENVDFVGGVQVVNNTKFVGCTFEENVLVANAEGYATNGKFCVFIDFEYNATGVCTVDFEGCTFDASGYGCVKVAGDKGANITVNVEDSSFTNTCPSNSWSQDVPKYDVKMTGDNITVNDLGGNTWSKGFGKG